jgi:predicted nucleic acid-binding protein
LATRLLDTNIVSYILNRHTLALAYQPHLTGYDWAVSFQTVAELIEGTTVVAARWAELAALVEAWPDLPE